MSLPRPCKEPPTPGDDGFNRWWGASKYCQVALGQHEQVARDGYAAGFRAGIEAAAKIAERHDAARDRRSRINKGPRFASLPEDAQQEIYAEERGEKIAAEIICREIRALALDKNHWNFT